MSSALALCTLLAMTRVLMVGGSGDHAVPPTPSATYYAQTRHCQDIVTNPNVAKGNWLACCVESVVQIDSTREQRTIPSKYDDLY